MKKFVFGLLLSAASAFVIIDTQIDLWGDLSHSKAEEIFLAKAWCTVAICLLPIGVWLIWVGNKERRKGRPGLKRIPPA